MTTQASHDHIAPVHPFDDADLTRAVALNATTDTSGTVRPADVVLHMQFDWFELEALRRRFRANKGRSPGSREITGTELAVFMRQTVQAKLDEICAEELTADELDEARS